MADNCNAPGGCERPRASGSGSDEGFGRDFGSALCQEHLEASLDDATELEYAERYAVASIIYYGSPGVNPGMTDAQFDGICERLKKRKAWKRVPYLEQQMLNAGSGYDLAKFPPELHARAGARMGKSCHCMVCAQGSD